MKGRKYEVHWIGMPGDQLTEELPTRPQALAYAEALRRMGLFRVRVLVQIDPPIDGKKEMSGAITEL